MPTKPLDTFDSTAGQLKEPVTQKGRQSANKILDATLQLLARQGLAQLTTNHIAEESGVKVGSLYRFFPNKEAILVALIERWFNSMMSTTNCYIEEHQNTLSFIELMQGLFIVNLEQEYQHSAAYREVYQGASTIPVLTEVFECHSRNVAETVAAVYQVQTKNNKRPEEIVEFFIFLHGTVSSLLNLVAGLKKNERQRHIKWALPMIKAAIDAFESPGID